MATTTTSSSMFDQYEDVAAAGRVFEDIIKNRMPHLSSTIAAKAGTRAAQRIFGVLEEEVLSAMGSEEETSTPPTPTTLLSLPRELRDQIWELAVVKEGQRRVTKSLDRERALVVSEYITNVDFPHLCRVNKQIREEVLDVFLAKHTFILKFETIGWPGEDRSGRGVPYVTHCRCLKWLKAMGPGICRRMRSVEFIREDRRTRTERIKAIWWVCKMGLAPQVEEGLVEQLLYGEGLQDWTDHFERLDAASDSARVKWWAKEHGFIWPEMTVFD